MIEIGKTYLDIWGGIHVIQGHTRTGGHYAEPDKDRVWSLAGEHFFIKSGRATGRGYSLVLLPPEQEIAFFEERIKQIESVNSEDKLKLVAPQLQNMRDRIAELKRK